MSRVDHIRQRALRALAERSGFFSVAAIPADDTEMVRYVAELLKYSYAIDDFPAHPVARMRALVKRLGVRYVRIYGVQGGV